MSDDAREYTRRAEEMLALALAAPTAEARQQFEQMARGWTALADHRNRSDAKFGPKKLPVE